MHLARIAELLAPFLRMPRALSEDASGADSTLFNVCHSEPAQAGQACPERSRRELAVLSATQLQSISTYIDMLLRWNARINLTAIRDPDQIVTRHFGESLFAARHLFPNPSAYSASSAAKAFEVADVGSGAGFPGIPLKLWVPQISLTLIESNHKKATFLREVTRALTLTDVNIQTARAESLRPASFDLITLRAVERFNAILPIAAGLLAPGGRLALLISSSQLNQATSTLPTFTWSPAHPIPDSRSRLLAIGFQSADPA